MAIVAPAAVDALSTPPSTSDPANFDVRADQLVLEMQAMVPQINASNTVTYQNALEAQAKASAASSSASAASTSASAASGSQGAAATSASAALASANAAAASLDSFDDRYLGSKATDPTTDNDGNALLDGAIYWNSVAREMRAWSVSGAVWAVAYVPLSGVALLSGATFAGPVSFPAFSGVTGFANGTGDGASYSVYNSLLRLHWGLGFADYTGAINGVYNARTGTWDVKGGYKVNGVAVQDLMFPAGTRMPFHQAAAPTGWTRDTSDAANNRMLRVVSSGGGGAGGSHSPILNDVVPAHTHGFSTGGVSADHTHGIADPGHNHVSGVPSDVSIYGTVGTGAVNGKAGTVAYSSSPVTSSSVTGVYTGGASGNHTHSGSTDSGSSSTNWQPRYIDLIICQKN